MHRSSTAPFSSVRIWIALAVAALVVSVTAPIASAAHPSETGLSISGTVLSGDEYLASAKVTAFSSSDGQGKRALGSARTNESGEFTLSYRAPSSADAVVYLTTDGGTLADDLVPGAFVLAVVVGTPVDGQSVTINELTTVGSAFAMAQFVQGAKMTGESPGLENAPVMVHHLVNIETGVIGATITNDDNGSEAETVNTFNQMGNLLVSCASDAGVCDSMLNLALPLQGRAPKDTFRAVVNMAKNPWQNVADLYSISAADFYQPDLSVAPAAWTLSLKFTGNPTGFAGPGNIAVAEDGQLWVTNNYVHEEGFIKPDCASHLLFKLDPATGDTITYDGGGLDGAGLGISFDPTGDLWVGNFGFVGTTCPINPFADSVSQFTSEGVAISPDLTRSPIPPFPVTSGGGWTNGDISWPQGTVSNLDGDIWIANCGSNSHSATGSITVYRDGNPDDWFVITANDLDKPFDLAFDTRANAWVSATNGDRIFAFDPHGNQIKGSPFYLGSGSKPMGVATDSRGNAWVSISGQVQLPCPDEGTASDPSHNPAIGMFNARGQQSPDGGFTGGGLTIPWGIAVDGADTVFVANFEKGGLSQFCGADRSACPDGYVTGDAISPDITGYSSELLDRNTGVAVDPSGNVWLANNWKDIPIQTDPAGDGVVVFIGLATPLRTPLIGPPQQP